MVDARAPAAVRDCSCARNASGAVCVRWLWASIAAAAPTAVASATMAADSDALCLVMAGLILLRGTAQPDHRGAVVVDQQCAVVIDADLGGRHQFARQLPASQIEHRYGHVEAVARRRLREAGAEEHDRLGGDDRQE